MRAELGGATAVVGRSYCCYGARWRPALMVFLRCCCSWVSLLELGRPREPEDEGMCWEQGREQPREGKVPAAVMAGEEGAAERERGRGEVALCGEAVRGERQRWKVQWWWLRRRRRWESLLGLLLVPAAEGKKKIKNRGFPGWRPVLAREKKRFSFLGFPLFCVASPKL